MRLIFTFLIGAIGVGLQAGASESAASTAVATAMTMYATQSGDTIERVVHNAMPNSPLSAEVLRKALAQANPKLVTGKAGQKFKTGTTLQVPDHAELVRTTLETFVSTSTEGSSRSGFGASDPTSRRHWIRYP